MYDADDWVFEAERDLEGIEKDVPALIEADEPLPFGNPPPRRRRTQGARVASADPRGARDRASESD